MSSRNRTETPPIHDVILRLLRIFKAVVDLQGFSAAEERLGIGRSTISKHIAGLEARLNVDSCRIEFGNERV